MNRETRYVFNTDERGRVQAFSGTLLRRDGERNTYQQRVAGGADRLPTDQGGHLFATIFRGPGERINLVPMDSNLNNGVWKSMENRWAQALDRGLEVKISVDVEYKKDSASTRPVGFDVTYVIDGETRSRYLKNSPGGQ